MPSVLITGGTGLIGKNLTRHLTGKGYEVIIVSRNPPHSSNKPMISFAGWNLDEGEIDRDAIAKADYIINLAGAGVMEKKWTAEYKKTILKSRTQGNALIIKALKNNPNKVQAVISSSAIGWYGGDPPPLHRKQGFIESDPPADDFLGDTCRLWEQSIHPAVELNKRIVTLRTGIVLTNDGGAFAEFVKPVRFGIAAILGSGKQILSWIHVDDLCRMYIYAMENEQLSGTYNAVAPIPITHKKLILGIAKLVKGQFYIPLHVPKFVLKLFLGERSIEILKSTTVSAGKIREAGYTFLYPAIDPALKELTKKN